MRTVVYNGVKNLEINSLSAECGVIIREQISDREIYHGAVTVIPSHDMQVLHTNNTIVLSDITVEPIPNNYGLVTWNGTVLSIT